MCQINERHVALILFALLLFCLIFSYTFFLLYIYKPFSRKEINLKLKFSSISFTFSLFILFHILYFYVYTAERLPVTSWTKGWHLCVCLPNRHDFVLYFLYFYTFIEPKAFTKIAFGRRKTNWIELE